MVCFWDWTAYGFLHRIPALPHDGRPSGWRCAPLLRGAVPDESGGSGEARAQRDGRGGLQMWRNGVPNDKYLFDAGDTENGRRSGSV